MIHNVPIPLDSRAAFDCLGRLETRSIEEKKELVYLNDKFIDLIENVHFLEAENQVLLHDRNLLKTGIESGNTGIDQIFQSELTTIRIGVEEKQRSREHFANEATLLESQVQDAYQRLQSINSASLGIPNDLDAELKRLSEIEAENAHYVRRIRYMEEKNRSIRGGLGPIQESINLMRLRKDQAESLKNEFANRRNDLINSIHNMEAENKSIIMNEHKYFIRDRKVDQTAFRNQFRAEIDAIRQNYEALRLRSKEEITIRLQTRIRDIQSRVPDHKQIIIGELRQVREHIRVVQSQISDTELKNTLVQNLIDNMRSEAAENTKFFEISLAERDAETDRFKTQCTQLAMEMEKLCDQQITLTAEIERYRKLLDGISGVNVTGLSSVSIPRTGASISVGTTSTIIEHRGPSPSPYIPSPLASGITNTQNIVHEVIQTGQNVVYTPNIPSAAQSGSVVQEFTGVSTYIPSPLASGNDYAREITSSVTGYTPYIPAPSATAESVVYETKQNSSTGYSTGYVAPYTTGRSLYDRYQSRAESRAESHTGRSVSYLPTSRIYEDTHKHYSLPPAPRVYTPIPAPSPAPAAVLETRVYTPIPSPAPIHEHTGTRIYHTETVREHQSSHGHEYGTYAGSQQQTGDHSRFASTVDNVVSQHLISRGVHSQNVGLTQTTDEESIDLDNVQRFTRWYKGRVKISDVTPDFIILENRSARKRANIGGFKLIHKTGFKSVFLDFPAHLILEPKDSLKIYARNSNHPVGSLVVETDEFDTTILSETALRNQTDDVKTWFKYVTNTEHDTQY
ncbi:unnamed protein product [Caenorhabditis angaria]|uniref:LTD domain-containing protein n=1 Tax=Caenorhabditis angaria TaxID=860376 RepID=A0A9P1IZ94_9PELO|nr:unnamed protein product [Caenorhabditis angaria]